MNIIVARKPWGVTINQNNKQTGAVVGLPAEEWIPGLAKAKTITKQAARWWRKHGVALISLKD